MKTSFVFNLNLIFSLFIVSSAFPASVFTVVGTVMDVDGTLATSGLEVIVNNETRKLTITTTVGKQEAGKYGVVFVDTENKSVAAEGDVLKITIKDDAQVLASLTYHLTAKDVEEATAIVDIQFKSLTLMNQPSVFTVAGTVRNADGTLAASGLEVIVSNETRKLSATAILGKQDAGKYSIAFVDTQNKAVAAEGDILKVTVKDAKQTLASLIYNLTATDIAKAVAIVDIKLGSVIPKNQPPVASFSFSPKTPAENTEITFDSSASYDPDGKIASYEWDFGDSSVGKGQVVKHSYASEGSYEVTLTVKDNDGTKTVVTEQIKVTDVSRLRDTINSKLSQRPVYPPYLLDTDSFLSSVNTIWQNVTDWFRRDDLTDNYEELYGTGIEYDSLRFRALLNARSFLEKGDIANAEKYLKKADTYGELSYMSFQGANYVFGANLEVAKTIAQSIKDGCQTAVTFGLKFVNPTAAKVADYIYDAIDFGIESYLGDKEKAKRDFMVKLGINIIFKRS